VKERGVGLEQDPATKTLSAVDADGQAHPVISDKLAYQAKIKQEADAAKEEQDFEEDDVWETAMNRKAYTRQREGDTQELNDTGVFATGAGEGSLMRLANKVARSKTKHLSSEKYWGLMPEFQELPYEDAVVQTRHDLEKKQA
jgi:hypothetical protein